eukprot:Nitzschia sp. Nitz4//scaffold45_size130396//106541//109024//NITZ4_003469-RA/size130396-processed-gene-0.201-mRNA-1//1//CDS//3329552458//8806//frame0
MRFVALVSGGKDSIYSVLECIRNGHELVACVHLGRPANEQEESYMYQTAASEVVRTMVEECLGVPLLLHTRVGTSIQTSLQYDNQDANDEVEDLYIALQNAMSMFDNVQAVSSGAILSTYQRVRIEHVCSRLGLVSLGYLWRLSPQKELLQRMLEDGIDAVLVRVACPPGLIPRKHLNKTLSFMWHSGVFERLHKQYQFHVCGEGGEYESLVLDSPLYKKKLVLDEVEIIEPEDDGVGELKILKCHAQDKTDDDIPYTDAVKLSEPPKTKEPTTVAASSETKNGASEIKLPDIQYIPSARQMTGGLIHFSEIVAPMAGSTGTDSEVNLAVQEANEVLSVLAKALERCGATPKDVLFVHLYLSEISHFASINKHYQNFFGVIFPPSRSCVAVGKGVLPGGRRVLLDCMVQPGSGEYLRTQESVPTSNSYAAAGHATKTSKLREVLHVQSISHWAPVCVGPYSQVNSLRSGVHFLAGQIGLNPATMELMPSWTLQLEQCWKNVAAVLDALEGGSLEHLLFGLVYVSHEVRNTPGAVTLVKSISSEQIKNNGGVIAGRMDSLVDETELYGGYEDEGTWEEMKGQLNEDDTSVQPPPFLVVSIPEMPKGAAVEVEVITATKTAANVLDIRDAATVGVLSNAVDMAPRRAWQTGHEFATEPSVVNEVEIEASVRVLGHQCASVGLVSAFPKEGSDTMDVDLDLLFNDMLMTLSKASAEGRSGLGQRQVLHVRLFYVATVKSSSGDILPCNDGVRLRSALERAVSKWDSNDVTFPATSVVPVSSIDLLHANAALFSKRAFLSMQVVLLDPVHLETNIWIRKNREYSTILDAQL